MYIVSIKGLVMYSILCESSRLYSHAWANVIVSNANIILIIVWFSSCCSRTYIYMYVHFKTTFCFVNWNWRCASRICVNLMKSIWIMCVDRKFCKMYFFFQRKSYVFAILYCMLLKKSARQKFASRELSINDSLQWVLKAITSVNSRLFAIVIFS